jgi:hypothetical protein
LLQELQTATRVAKGHDVRDAGGEHEVGDEGGRAAEGVELRVGVYERGDTPELTMSSLMKGRKRRRIA